MYIIIQVSSTITSLYDMPLDLTLPADFKCSKPAVEYSSTYIAPTPTVGPSFNANLNGAIGKIGTAYNAGTSATYTGPNSEIHAGFSHSGSTFSNKVSNTYTVGANFNF